MAQPGSLVARDIIRSARDEHPTFDDRRHPDAVLLRALGRYQRELIPAVVRVNRNAMTQVLETPLPLANFEAGIALPDYAYPVSVEVESPATEVPGLSLRRRRVDLVSWTDQARFRLAAYIRNNVLYLTGSATDWAPFVKLLFYYVPQVDPLAGTDSILALPNAAEPCLVAFLAAFMAKRGGHDEQLERPDALWYRAQWREAEEAFLSAMAQETQAQVSVVNEVF